VVADVSELGNGAAAIMGSPERARYSRCAEGLTKVRMKRMYSGKEENSTETGSARQWQRRATTMLWAESAFLSSHAVQPCWDVRRRIKAINYTSRRGPPRQASKLHECAGLAVLFAAGTANLHAVAWPVVCVSTPIFRGPSIVYLRLGKL